MTFQEWLAELDAIAKARGYSGEKLSADSGEECWRESYDDGMSPMEAWDHDQSYA